MIWDGKDVTPEPDHWRNRWNCQEANRQNRIAAERYSIPRFPYYHYDALTGKVHKLDAMLAAAKAGD